MLLKITCSVLGDDLPLTSVLIIDDNTRFIVTLRDFLESRRGYRVVATVSDPRHALENAADCRPDVILLDLSMPGINGLDLIEPLRRTCPDAVVIVLTTHDADEYVLHAKEHGAHGFVTKSDATDRLLPEVERHLQNRAARR